MLVTVFTFKISLWFFANRTDLGCACACVDMTAIAADPNCFAIVSKNFAVVDLIDPEAKTGFVVFFDGGYHVEDVGDVVETFVTGCAGEKSVGFRPLVMLAACGVFEGFGGV